MKLLPGMRERKSGHIINISSIGVQTNTPRFSAYVASKSALDAFSRCVAPECVADNVKFTTIYMPLVRTPMIAPTDMYKAFPTMSPDEAAQMLSDAMIDKPKRKASQARDLRRGALRGVAGGGGHRAQPGLPAVPGLIGGEGQGQEEGALRRSDGDGAQKSTEAPPAGDEEMSTEAVAMAYLLRGVHF